MHLVSNKDNARVDEVISFGEISIMPSCKSFGTRQDHQKFEVRRLALIYLRQDSENLKMNN
jgi:hypothetical protein